MHRIGAEEKVALVPKVLLDVVVGEALEDESKFHSGDKRACPLPQELQLISGHLQGTTVDVRARVCLTSDSRACPVLDTSSNLLIGG